MGLYGSMKGHQAVRRNVNRSQTDVRSASRSPIHVLIIAVPPMRTLDVFGPAEVFGDANWLHGGNPAYKVNIISACTDRVVPNYLGTPVHTDRAYHEYRGPVDTLLVAGCMGPRELRYEPGFLEWLQVQCARARRFGSICTGAFVLAKAGLLDGRRATTHWNWATGLAQDYPRIAVDPNPIYVRDGSCYTSAGDGRDRSVPRFGGRRSWQSLGPSGRPTDGGVSTATRRAITIQRDPRSPNRGEPSTGRSTCLAPRPPSSGSLGELTRASPGDECAQFRSPIQTGDRKNSWSAHRGSPSGSSATPAGIYFTEHR